MDENKHEQVYMFESKHCIYIFKELKCNNSVFKQHAWYTLADMDKRSKLMSYLRVHVAVHCVSDMTA